MLVIRNKIQAVMAAIVVSGLALLGMTLHIQINYSPELRDMVRVQGTISTLIVLFPIALFFMQQLMKNHKLTMELQRLVNRDRLTDVATRDVFFARLTEFPDAYGVSLMIDIDNFKTVNDTHGHLAEDEVIHAVAQIMRAQIRDVDIVCRFGGEEFVVFLQNSTTRDGLIIAERIRESTEAAITPTVAGDIKITISVGGSMKDRMEHVDEAIKRADECLYLAKAARRNRTVVDWLSQETALHRRAG